MIELETVVSRREYKLSIDWNCSCCGHSTDLYGKSFDGKKTPLNWEDILHKRCRRCGILEKPIRECTLCNTQYEFAEVGCDRCDNEISRVMELEEVLTQTGDAIKKAKRKKENFEDLEFVLQDVHEELASMNYSPCGQCAVQFVRFSYNACPHCR